jgi:hypothetical protein
MYPQLFPRGEMNPRRTPEKHGSNRIFAEPIAERKNWVRTQPATKLTNTPVAKNAGNQGFAAKKC